MHVGEGHRRSHCLQRWRVMPGGQPLGTAQVGAAQGADHSGRPRLSGRPGDHVHTVAGLVHVRLELAVGAVAPADVLGDHHVPGLDCAENVEGV
jgi:hypothetical protein